jgi:hypothetical protein
VLRKSETSISGTRDDNIATCYHDIHIPHLWILIKHSSVVSGETAESHDICLYIYTDVRDLAIMEGGWDRINWFNPITLCACLPAVTRISDIICRGSYFRVY